MIEIRQYRAGRWGWRGPTGDPTWAGNDGFTSASAALVNAWVNCGGGVPALVFT